MGVGADPIFGDVTVEVGRGVAVSGTVDGAAVGEPVAVGGGAAVGDGGSEGVGDAVS